VRNQPRHSSGVGAAGSELLGLRRARELLTPDARAIAERQEAAERGYLDLLAEDPESTGTTQDLMTTNLVPAIYERYWRPGLARVAKGLTGPGMAEEARIARLLMGLSPGDVVLDVACGPGNFSREFARTVGDEGLVIGIDASRTMLERGVADLVPDGPSSEPGGRTPGEASPGARREPARPVSNLALIRGDATELPFRDATFDAVCCFAALHLFADPFAGLGEMRRVLRPGGRIALMTSVRRKVTPPPLKPIVERLSGMRMFEGEEVVRALQERGFTNIRQRLAGVVQFVGGRLPEQ
jgi:ubiquinone/menaquinone biosynthesis C-methylase UbiE